VKPSNIMLTLESDVRIIDFGIALVADSEISRIEGIAGSPSYMSPEQVRAKELDNRTDLFSFGVVLYEMATGVLPFRGESSGVIFNAILERAPVAPIRLNPDLPSDMEGIINKALEKDRNLRYQSANELRSDLKRLRRNFESSAARVSVEQGSSPQGRHIALIVTLASLVLTLLIGGIAFTIFRLLRHLQPAPIGSNSHSSQTPLCILRSPTTGACLHSFGETILFSATERFT